MPCISLVCSMHTYCLSWFVFPVGVTRRLYSVIVAPPGHFYAPAIRKMVERVYCVTPVRPSCCEQNLFLMSI